VTFGLGSKVLADLAAGLTAHSKAVRRPVVVGCVPWFSAAPVADALCRQEAVCIVVDKRGIADKRGRIKPAVRRTRDTARAILSSYLPAFDTVLPRVDGQPAIIGPRDFPLEEYELGPVRVSGWRGEWDPILHAKVAVCCEAWIGEDDFGYERSGISAVRAWIGSANWSDHSANHVELGAWIDDRELADRCLDFVGGVIRDSEPLDSNEPRPKPELAEADLDDDAFADYAAQFGFDDPDRQVEV
jgi:hypothetical protein